MRILVTGGAGFLGAHLCRALLPESDSLVCLDNLSSGSRDGIADLERDPRFSFIEHDVRDPIHLKVDRIYNLACVASPARYGAQPIDTLMTSVLGAKNMLDLAHRCDARIVQASTSEVYGDPERHPQVEGYAGNVSCVGPRACYDEGKRAAETLFEDYRRMHGVDARIARIFNTYGPGMRSDDGRVVPAFIAQALSGAPLTIQGDGSQTRSFCYVDDLIDGLRMLMEHPMHPDGPVNLGQPDEFTIATLARLVIELTGSGSGVTHLPLPKDDPTRRRPDIARARAMLGWAPRTPLRVGLERTIDWVERRCATPPPAALAATRAEARAVR